MDNFRRHESTVQEREGWVGRALVWGLCALVAFAVAFWGSVVVGLAWSFGVFGLAIIGGLVAWGLWRLRHL